MKKGGVPRSRDCIYCLEKGGMKFRLGITDFVHVMPDGKKICKRIKAIRYTCKKCGYQEMYLKKDLPIR